MIVGTVVMNQIVQIIRDVILNQMQTHYVIGMMTTMPIYTGKEIKEIQFLHYIIILHMVV